MRSIPEFGYVSDFPLNSSSGFFPLSLSPPFKSSQDQISSSSSLRSVPESGYVSEFLSFSIESQDLNIFDGIPQGSNFSNPSFLGSSLLCSYSSNEDSLAPGVTPTPRVVDAPDGLNSSLGSSIPNGGIPGNPLARSYSSNEVPLAPGVDPASR